LFVSGPFEGEAIISAAIAAAPEANRRAAAAEET
jgi:hypothetical protein